MLVKVYGGGKEFRWLLYPMMYCGLMDGDTSNGPQDEIFFRKLTNLDAEVKALMETIASIERNLKLVETGLRQEKGDTLGETHGTLLDYSRWDWNQKQG